MVRFPDTDDLRALSARLDEVLEIIASGRVSEAKQRLEALRRLLPGPVADGATVRRKR